jgi:hypothetical protein
MQSENTQYKFLSDDLPELHDAANSASLKAQNKHLVIIKSYLVLLVIGSLVTVYSDKIEYAPQVGIIIFLATLFLTILQAYRRHDKIWYKGRALAESVKTRSWRFIMRAEPYEDADNLDIVRALFRTDLKEILRENQDLGSNLKPQKELGETITENMNLIRSLQWEDRLNVYREYRIDDQRKWYAKKARSNDKIGNYWFYGLIIVHVIIIVCLIIKISKPELPLPADTFIVIAGGIVTWTQVKKYQDLSTAYTLTAREIGIIKGDSELVKSEKQLSDFVKDAENAFSREHTQWSARKDK